MHFTMFICNVIVSWFLDNRPTWITPLKDITCQEEESITFECELSRAPTKVDWLKSGKLIKPDPKRKIISKHDGPKCTFTIPSTIIDDTSDYTCRVGDVETTAKLTVKGWCWIFFAYQ